MLAQVISAITEYLPYKRRLAALSAMSNDLNTLALTMENDWFKVSRGLMTDEEINDLHMDIKQRKHQATVKSFPNTSLPEDAGLLERADSRSRQRQLNRSAEGPDARFPCFRSTPGRS